MTATGTEMRTTERVGADHRITRLTAKERDVLALVAEGYSNERIAQELAVTARTVETHNSRIFAKLDLEADTASHRRVLAVLAYLHGTASLWLDTPTIERTTASLEAAPFARGRRVPRRQRPHQPR